MTGRPSDYSDNVAATILERLADGASLRAICADEAMPARSTVFLWLAENKSFSDQYARAREAQGDGEFDKITEVAESATPENVNVARLRIDALKWRASKLAPKKYGDKVAHVGGDESDAPINHSISVKFV